MLDERASARSHDGYVDFWAAGAPAKGEFHCADCGYGVTIHRALPVCPMCGGSAWEQTAWHPFSQSPEMPSRLV